MMPKADGIKETHKARAANATARISKVDFPYHFFIKQIYSEHNLLEEVQTFSS